VWRFLAGVASAIILMSAGLVIWRSQAGAGELVPAFSSEADTPFTLADTRSPPEATEKTREEKRFSRYDKDKNGGVSRDEYLMSRQKNYAKLDLNKDGKLSFDEYAVKTVAKFTGADRDHTGVLTPAEFLTTKIVRKTTGVRCPPPTRLPQPPAAADDEDS
jgi:hypothetical protein